jgi:hypothetical protein
MFFGVIMKLSELQEMGFQKSGTIIKIQSTTNVNIGFEFEEGLAKRPYVYLWVDVTNPKDVIVLYCGKAGKGIKARMSQHKQGFKGEGNGGSESGRKKYIFLKNSLGNKRIIEVWSKASRSKTDESICLRELSATVKYWLYLNRMA